MVFNQAAIVTEHHPVEIAEQSIMIVQNRMRRGDDH